MSPNPGQANQQSIPWRFLLVTFLVLAIITTAIPIFTWAARPQGATFTGMSYESVGDAFFYLNLIDQAKSGEVLFRNLMTSEPHGPTFFNPLFLMMGIAARILHLDALTVFHAARVLLIFPFLVLLYVLLRDAGLACWRAKFAVLVVVLSGGLYLVNHEASTFLSLLYSPLSILSLITTLIWYLVVIRSFTRGWTAWRVLLVVLTALLQAMTHPYVLIVWGFAPALFLFVQLLLRREQLWGALRKYLPILISIVLAYGYLFAIVSFHPILQTWTSQAEIHRWWVILQFLFFGALLPLALIGCIARWKLITTNTTTQFLLFAFLTTFLLSNSPYPYAGRLQLILHLPLAYFTVLGMIALFERLRNREAWRIVAIFFFGLTLSDNVRHLQINLTRDYIESYSSYIDEDTSKALHWIRNNTPKDSVLLHATTWDTLVAQQTQRSVYCTHGGLTRDYVRRLFECLGVYAGLYDEEKLASIIREGGIDYLLVTPRDRRSGFNEGERFGGTYYQDQYAFNLKPENYPFFTEAHRTKESVIYKVTLHEDR